MFDRRADLVPAEARDRALEELLIAEGSDWFWWYGDDHSSDHDVDFDDLFRRHLRMRTRHSARQSGRVFATNISSGAGPDSPAAGRDLTSAERGREFPECGAVARRYRAGGALQRCRLQR